MIYAIKCFKLNYIYFSEFDFPSTKLKSINKRVTMFNCKKDAIDMALQLTFDDFPNMYHVIKLDEEDMVNEFD